MPLAATGLTRQPRSQRRTSLSRPVFIITQCLAAIFVLCLNAMPVSEAAGLRKAAALPLISHQPEEDVNEPQIKLCTLPDTSSDDADSSATVVTAAASTAFVQRLADEWPGFQVVLPQRHPLDVRFYIQQAQHELEQAQPLQATTESVCNVLQARGCTGNSRAVGSCRADVGRGAAVHARLQQRVQAAQTGSSSVAASAGAAVKAAAAATPRQAAPRQATPGRGATPTAASTADEEVGKQDVQHCSQLRRCGELLQALGSRVWSLLPQRYVCHNLACCNVAGASDQLLVAGKSCVCGGCRVARYCSKECQVQHRPQHKAVCKRLAAATAAQQLAAGAGAV